MERWNKHWEYQIQRILDRAAKHALKAEIFIDQKAKTEDSLEETNFPTYWGYSRRVGAKDLPPRRKGFQLLKNRRHFKENRLNLKHNQRF